MSDKIADDIRMADPNLMSEIYRKFQPTSIPLRIEKHLNFIDISDDGFMLLGSGTLNGRYWTGSIHYFNDTVTDISEEKCFTGMNCQTVVTDGKFVDGKDKVVIGEDSGCISLLSLAEVDDEGDVPTTHVVVNVATYDHDSAVLSLSVSPNRRSLLSGSMDRCIKVWDVEGLITQYTFRPAHAHHVTSLQYANSSDSIFASCSLDGSALVWDVRLDKPASVITAVNGEGLTSITWDPSDENTLAIGSNFGSVSVYDIRSKNCKASCLCFNRPLHKLAFNSSGMLAACADSQEVKILNYKTDTLNVIYKDVRHDHFVRGIAWHLKEDLLYSCGWDTKVFSHAV